MVFVKVLSLLLITWMNKSTHRKWTNLNSLKLNLNLKEREELFINLKYLRVKEDLDQSVILLKAGLIKSLQLHTTSLDLMLLQEERVVEPQLEITWLK